MLVRRIGLISDIHANLEALEAVLTDASIAGVDVLVCLGDITGYGPDPGECTDLVRDSCNVVVIGNHDEAILSKDVSERFRGPAREALEYNRTVLTRAHKQYLNSLPERAEIGDLSVTHACFGPNKYDYLYGVEIASQAFAYMPTRFGAVGHTHLPSSFQCCMNSKGEPSDITASSVIGKAAIDIPDMHRGIVNPGSVGQPRDRNPDASWGVLDLDGSTFQVRRVWYDVEKVQAKMVASGLPQTHSERLRIGA